MTETLSQPASGGIVRQALAFIKSPHAMRPGPRGPTAGEVFGSEPPAPRETVSQQLAPLLKLWLLNLGVLFALLPLLMLWTRGMGIEPPKMTQDMPQGILLLLAVAILPPLEEIVFRGWLTGKRWQLVLLAGLVLALGGLLVSQATAIRALAIAGLGAGVAMIAAGLWLTKDRNGTPDWFVRQFRWWFWASCVIFAAAHYSNYPALTLAHLPVVLPQLWSGLVFGFVRLRFGILRSMTLHVASNAFVLGAFYLFGIPAA